MSKEKFMCTRRLEVGPHERGKDLDKWEVRENGDQTCSFCGSLHPDIFLSCVEKALDDKSVRIILTDKRYKIYVKRPEVANASEGGIKFYTQHAPEGAWTNKINDLLRKLFLDEKEDGADD